MISTDIVSKRKKPRKRNINDKVHIRIVSERKRTPAPPLLMYYFDKSFNSPKLVREQYVSREKGHSEIMVSQTIRNSC